MMNLKKKNQNQKSFQVLVNFQILYKIGPKPNPVVSNKPKPLDVKDLTKEEQELFEII